MTIELFDIKPTFMTRSELTGSDIFLQERINFKKGGKYLIKGVSGKGKTSLLNFIYGINPNYEGRITYKGKNANHNLPRNKLSYVFQDLKLFPTLSVFENIQLKNKLTNVKSKDEIFLLISQINLSEKENQPLLTLSMGQQQKVAILRALCQPFDFIILDEPFSHLDYDNMKKMSDIILDHVKQNNAGIIITAVNDECLFKYDAIMNL